MFLPLLLSLTSIAPTDTIVVNTAKMEGPYPIHTPYQTDSLNMKGSAFDLNEILDHNKALIQRDVDANAITIKHGEKLLVAAPDSLPAMRLLHFNVQASRYTKARIEVKGLSTYKMYVNGNLCSNKQLNLVPGRTEITLQVLTQKNNKDSFDVKVIGENLGDLQVNATGKRPFTIGQQTWGDHYRSVALSPSGKYLVTVSYYTRKDGSNQYTTILTEMNSGRELLHRNEYVNLRWLRGNRDVLYYTRPSGRGKELVAFTPENGQERVLATNIPDGNFSISPKEDYLILDRTEEGAPSKNGLKFIEQPDDRQPGWRNRNSLWRYDLKTGICQRLTFGSASVGLADISMDGRQLLLQYGRTDVSKLPIGRTTFVRMDAYTGKTDTLLADTTFINGARFSPDAKQLLISATPTSFAGIGSEVKPGQIPQGFDNRLYLYDINTHTTRPALPHFNPSVANYEWSWGNGMIYFTADDRMGHGLFQLNPKTLQIISYKLPTTYVQDFSVATASKSAPRAVFFGQSPQRARDMYTCVLNKEKPATKHIGTINFDELYKDVAIAPSTSWQFKATRGDSIDGFYLLPPNFDKSKKYPMIVYYYGGCSPSSNMLESWCKRILQGSRLCRQQAHWLHRRLVWCFMTEYLQTRTDIFAAAISHAGISNIASYWGGGYWGYSYGETAQYGSFPWNNPDLYVKQSPLFNADKIHTPLLLLHGTVDTNVPTNESQQLYNALKILGRDVAYVQVEGENHVVVDYHKRLAWLNVIYAWFAKYLQNDATWWNELSK